MLAISKTHAFPPCYDTVSFLNVDAAVVFCLSATTVNIGILTDSPSFHVDRCQLLNPPLTTSSLRVDADLSGG